MNHLEQLVSEWYEYNGYFVRRNVHVGKLDNGGYKGELDIVAFHPLHRHLVHVEPSMDSDSWERREKRYLNKFTLGRKYIPKLFDGLIIPKKIEQIALFVYASSTKKEQIADGWVATIADFFNEIVPVLRKKHVKNEAIPQQFPLLRTIQYCLDYEQNLFEKKKTTEQSSPQKFSFVRSSDDDKNQ